MKACLLLLGLCAAACSNDAPPPPDLSPAPDLVTAAPDQGAPPDLSVARPDLSSAPDAASADTGCTPHYYDAVLGKTGTDLLAALTARVAGQRALTYDQARDALYATVADLDSTDRVECVYTGRVASGVTDRASATAARLNTEHLWPQSLGATGIAQADLHHLYPSDVEANGRRGNYPFGVVLHATYTAPIYDGGNPARLGTAADGATVFEPRDRKKGDVARALLYFFTRYHDSPPSKFSLQNFTREHGVLLRWHELDPPDDAERARNKAVYLQQGNCNPFVDHPEFVRDIKSFL